MQHILVTGGAGYIGSHTMVELLEAGYQVSVADNFANSSPALLDTIKEITKKNVTVFNIDLCDQKAVANLFETHTFDGVIHFAALKAVGESVAQPLRYYRTNITSLLNVVEAMQQHNIFTLVFSSSAAVYGDQDSVPITETAPLLAGSPYGRTKVMCEQILQDVAAADQRWQITLLRYFNPVGAHPSGKIGENPNGVPPNLLPYIARVADGTYPSLNIFANDYPTRDGTGVRDYIHVVDLARGHIAALNHTHASGTAAVYNLGSGSGYSVYEMLHAFEKVVGHTIPAVLKPRRPGDPAESYASISKAKKELGWEPQKTLADICTDAWRWQLANKK